MKKMNYVNPSVEVITVDIEKGFATTGVSIQSFNDLDENDQELKAF